MKLLTTIAVGVFSIGAFAQVSNLGNLSLMQVERKVSFFQQCKDSLKFQMSDKSEVLENHMIFEEAADDDYTDAYFLDEYGVERSKVTRIFNNAGKYADYANCSIRLDIPARANIAIGGESINNVTEKDLMSLSKGLDCEFDTDYSGGLFLGGKIVREYDDEEDEYETVMKEDVNYISFMTTENLIYGPDYSGGLDDMDVDKNNYDKLDKYFMTKKRMAECSLRLAHKLDQLTGGKIISTHIAVDGTQPTNNNISTDEVDFEDMLQDALQDIQGGSTVE